MSRLDSSIRENRIAILRSHYATCQSCPQYGPWKDTEGCRALVKPCEILDNLLDDNFECPRGNFKSTKEELNETKD